MNIDFFERQKIHFKNHVATFTDCDNKLQQHDLRKILQKFQI